MVLPLIGLVGRARSGKDTVAKLLQEGYGYEVAAFADPLRELVYAIDPIVDYTMPYSGRAETVTYSDALGSVGYERAKDRFRDFRGVLQRTGTDGVRDILGAKWGLRELLGDDLWVVLGGLRADKAKGNSIPLAFTDVRFPNEADMIRNRGGAIVRIARPSIPIPEFAHISETALDDYEEDHTLVNDGDLRDLRLKVETLVRKL